MLFADFIKRLMPIAQSTPEFREHFPPASWKQLFDIATDAGDGLLVFEVEDLSLAELDDADGDPAGREAQPPR